MYETLQMNLPIPSISTMYKFLNDKPNVKEGSLRSQELVSYLIEYNLKHQVWLAEDGTKIISRLKYSTKYNNIVGLVLPIDKLTGIYILYLIYILCNYLLSFIKR